MITAFILDDQDSNITVLQSQLARFFPNISIGGTSTDAVSALAQIRALQPDLLFLDIDMPGLDGFGVLQQLAPAQGTEVIFVTAYESFALKAFEFHAAGYLTKPVEIQKFVPAVNKACERIVQRRLSAQKRVEEPASNGRRITLPTRTGMIFVDADEVRYCESNGNYTRFHLLDGQLILVSKQIGQFEQLLPRSSFVRIHDRYIVNLKHIRAYHRGNGGIVVLDNDTELPVAARRKEQLLRVFS